MTHFFGRIFMVLIVASSIIFAILLFLQLEGRNYGQATNVQEGSSLQDFVMSIKCTWQDSEECQEYVKLAALEYEQERVEKSLNFRKKELEAVTRKKEAIENYAEKSKPIIDDLKSDILEKDAIIAEKDVEILESDNQIRSLNQDLEDEKERNHELTSRATTAESQISRFRNLQNDLKVGRIVIFNKFDDQSSGKDIVVGTEYKDILSAHPQYTRFWCYILVKRHEDGEQESLYVTDLNGNFLQNPDHVSMGLPVETVDYARSVCKPYRLE